MGEPAAVAQVDTRHIVIGGRVQGVGFRPFVKRLAAGLGLVGWVRNRAGTVEILVQGPGDRLERFATDLVGRAPPFARPCLEATDRASPVDCNDFSIHPSVPGIIAEPEVAPDQSICEDCLAEIHDRSSRRYRYPFANCTQCGPRYTIIGQLPYDRANTTMAGFPLCPDCQREYAAPSDRRFHAEPIACPRCGPRLWFTSADGQKTHAAEGALAATVAALRAGLIVGVKGVGGYHLMCDATREASVARLRRAKQRPHKPFAVMLPLLPADGASTIRRWADLDPIEEAALYDPARPIVLVRKHSGAPIAPSVAPGLADVGLMLPYSPLHHLLLEMFGRPVVATSANVSGEPVLTDGTDVERRLGACCDAFLHHDRPIERPADDPVIRVIAGRRMAVRLGRGVAPIAIRIAEIALTPALACGGQLKTTVALAKGDRVIVSPHIGDMGSLRSLRIFEQTIEGLQTLYGVAAHQVIHDAHPDFATSRWAARQGKPTTRVLHHHAHASALLGEHGRRLPTLVFAWDGLGLGEDGTLWGGETLLGAPGAWRRVGCFRSFRLVGGDRVAYEPWRSAGALCWEAGLAAPPVGADVHAVRRAWERGAGTPSTSVGRLFDAAACLLGLADTVSYDGHAPALVEAAAQGAARGTPLPVHPTHDVRIIDWEPLVRALLDPSSSVAARAAAFHAHLAATMVAEAAHWRAREGIDVVGLTGGVFQNRRLTETTVALLEAEGCRVLLHERIPPNDGGLSFGQAVEFAARPVVAVDPP